MSNASTAPQQVQLDRLTVEDAGELLTLQRAAYLEEAQQTGDLFLPALTETLDELIEEIRSGTGFVLRLNGRLVGAVRIRVAGGESNLGRLTVAPDMQGRGFGGALLYAAEEEAAKTDLPNRNADEVAVLYTGRLSESSIRLYTRRGYLETRREQLSPGVQLVHMRRGVPVV